MLARCQDIVNEIESILFLMNDFYSSTINLMVKITAPVWGLLSFETRAVSWNRRQFFMNVISIGEVLWDVSGEKESLGGAPLNFSMHLRRLGHQVSFISAVGNDDRGQRILRKLEDEEMPTAFVRVDPQHPTGYVYVRFGRHG